MHQPNHNETLNSILKFFDAQRQSNAPGDATRVDQPEAIMQNGEVLYPQESQEPWVGEAVTDILHYFDVKDPDPDVAATQKEALSGTIDLFSPQGLGGLMLMGAGSIGRAAGNIGNRAIRIARGANRKPAKGVAVGEGGYAQLYETDSVSKYASRKLPRITQERGVNIFKDKTYNYVESVKPRRGGMSIHTVKVRGRDKYSNEQNLGFLEFEVQDLNPMYKGQFGPIDEAIEMVSGKGLESPKLISNVKFKTTDIGSPRDAARALRMVFDRFDDDWIIHENLMTLDSINMMLSSILRNYGEEIEFFANRGRLLYKEELGSYVAKFSPAQRAAQKAREIATVSEVESGAHFDKTIKRLTQNIEESGKLVGSPNFRAEGFALSSRPFVMKSFKDKLAAVFGMSAVQMKEMLDSIADEQEMIGIESFQE